MMQTSSMLMLIRTRLLVLRHFGHSEEHVFLSQAVLSHTSASFLFVNGLNAISCIWNALLDTTINMSDHLTKGLSWALFHQHANFLLSHVPPVYSPIYKPLFGMYTNHHVDVDTFVPSSFTTPMTAAAARVYTPIREDYVDNPWLIVLWHG
jgi:hypothetical protein